MAKNYYEILRLPPSASEAQIRTQLQAELHHLENLARIPNRRSEAAARRETLEQIQKTLLNPAARGYYDASLNTSNISTVASPEAPTWGGQTWVADSSLGVSGQASTAAAQEHTPHYTTSVRFATGIGAASTIEKPDGGTPTPAEPSKVVVEKKGTAAMPQTVPQTDSGTKVTARPVDPLPSHPLEATQRQGSFIAKAAILLVVTALAIAASYFWRHSPAVQQVPEGINRAGDEQGIRITLAEWIESFKQKDVSAQADCYAPEVEVYFRKRNVSRAFIAEDKARAFATFAEIRKFEINDIKVSFESSEQATATFNKTWDTIKTSGKPFAGSELERLDLTFVEGKWRIKREEELTIYYVVTH
jgi:ketosteroid isomerase-like protein